MHLIILLQYQHINIATRNYWSHYWVNECLSSRRAGVGYSALLWLELLLGSRCIMICTLTDMEAKEWFIRVQICTLWRDWKLERLLVWPEHERFLLFLPGSSRPLAAETCWRFTLASMHTHLHACWPEQLFNLVSAASYSYTLKVCWLLAARYVWPSCHFWKVHDRSLAPLIGLETWEVL